MVVYCPGCGSKISVEPATPGGQVECPRCHSTFATAGLKSAVNALPPKRFRPKKAGRSKSAVAAILIAILLIVAGGTAAALYFTGHLGRWFGGSGTNGAAPVEWKEYVNADARFRVLFPGTPTRETIPPPSRLKPGAKPTIVSFTVDTPDAKYSVAFEEFGGSQTPEQFIDAQRTDLTTGRSGRLIGEKDVTVDKYKGKAFVIETPKRGTIHMQFVVAGQRLYKLIAVGVRKAADADDVAKFFGSFRIT